MLSVGKKKFLLKFSQSDNQFKTSKFLLSNLYNFIELLSKIVSCLSLYSVNSSTWTTDETKVLVKYGLVGMYKENKDLFDNMILLQKSGSSKYLPTQILYKVISMIDSYTL